MAADGIWKRTLGCHPLNRELKPSSFNILAMIGLTAIVPYRVALCTPSSCNLVFTTSKGVVAAAAMPPAIPPAPN